MSSLYVVRQLRAHLSSRVEFYQAPDVTWYARAMLTRAELAQLHEADVQAELLDDGVDAWEQLYRCGRFDPIQLRHFFNAVGSALYPLVRLAPSGSALLLPSAASPRERRLESEVTLSRLIRNRHMVSPAAQKHLGAGNLSFAVPEVPSLELVELELSDSSVLLAWSWVWLKSSARSLS